MNVSSSTKAPHLFTLHLTDQATLTQIRLADNHPLTTSNLSKMKIFIHENLHRIIINLLERFHSTDMVPQFSKIRTKHVNYINFIYRVKRKIKLIIAMATLLSINDTQNLNSLKWSHLKQWTFMTIDYANINVI